MSIKIKNWENFNESHSENEFDEKWDEVENTIDGIIQMTDKYSEEELQMMNSDELNRISNAHEIEREIDTYQRPEEMNESTRPLNRNEKALRSKVDDVVIYYLKNRHKIELEELVDMFTGSQHYNDYCNGVLSILRDVNNNG